MVVVDPPETLAMTAEPDLPVELRVLRDCAWATWQLERMTGRPVVAGPPIGASLLAGRDLTGWPADQLAAGPGEEVFTRTVRLAPLVDGAVRWPVAQSRLWLAAERVPAPVLSYLLGTCLTLGQVLRLVALPVRTQRIGWYRLRAGAAEVEVFGCPAGAAGLRRRMAVLTDVAVAVTEETFFVGLQPGSRGRRRQNGGVVAGVAEGAAG